jgi:uncharacterized damage-inducible protein DinB
MARPLNTDYAAWYAGYVNRTTGDNPTVLIEKYSAIVNAFVENLPEEKANYAYAEGKWTVKQVVQHLIDSERIFVYRALRFCRKDATQLSGFEENDYASNDFSEQRSFNSIKEEFYALRKSTDLFITHLNEEQLQQSGEANNNAVTVNAICFIIFGHLLHHKAILEERYLN